ALMFFFSGRRRHTRFSRDWSSDVCSSDLPLPVRNGGINMNNLKQFKQMFLAQLKLTLREKQAWFWGIFFPVILMVIFMIIFSGEIGRASCRERVCMTLVTTCRSTSKRRQT